MTYRKRKSQKTGANTRRTTTQSSKGTRITNSTTSSLGGKNKRTYSWSWSKGGRLKQTFTDNVNGYVKRRSRTLGSKNKKAPSTRRSTRRSTRQKSSGDGMGSIYWLVMLILAILFVTFPMSGLAIAGTVGIIVVSWILLPYLVWILIFFVIFWLFF